LADADARGRLARNARAWAVRELAWATMAERYGALYTRLETRRRRTPARSATRADR
jgi:hypothetical protein